MLENQEKKKKNDVIYIRVFTSAKLIVPVSLESRDLKASLSFLKKRTQNFVSTSWEEIATV